MVHLEMQTHNSKEEVELFLLKEIKEDIEMGFVKRKPALNAINRNFLDTNYGFEEVRVKKIIDDKVIGTSKACIYTFENILNLKVNDTISLYHDYNQAIKIGDDLNEHIISKHTKSIHYKYRHVIEDTFQTLLDDNKIPKIVDKRFIDSFMKIVKIKVQEEKEEDEEEARRLEVQDKQDAKRRKDANTNTDWDKDSRYDSSYINVNDKIVTPIDTGYDYVDCKIELKNKKFNEVFSYSLISSYKYNAEKIFKYLLQSTDADFIYYKKRKKVLDINLKPYMITLNGTRVNRDKLAYICEKLLDGTITADSNLIYYLNKLSKKKTNLLFIEKVTTHVSGTLLTMDVEVKPIDDDNITFKIMNKEKSFTFDDLKDLMINYKQYYHYDSNQIYRKLDIKTNKIIKFMAEFNIDKTTFLEYARKKVMLSKLSDGDEDEDD